MNKSIPYFTFDDLLIIRLEQINYFVRVYIGAEWYEFRQYKPFAQSLAVKNGLKLHDKENCAYKGTMDQIGNFFYDLNESID